MGRNNSIFLIVILLAALFIGPMVVLSQDKGNLQPAIPFVPPAAERIVDAPASLPAHGSSNPMADARPHVSHIPGLGR